MSYLKSFLKKKKGKLAVALLLLLGQVVGTLLIPYLSAGLVDRGILEGDMDAIILIGVQMLIAAVGTMAVSIAGCYYSSDIAADFGRSMREAVFRKSQDLSIREFDDIGVSSMITRTTSDISSLQNTLGMLLQMIVPAPLIVISSIIMTAMVSPRLTAVPLACIVLFFIVTWAVFKKTGPLSRQIQVRMDSINQIVREAITGIRVIRAFDNGSHEQRRADRAFEDYGANMIRLNKTFAVLNPAIWMVMGLSMSAIIWYGGMFSAAGAMQIGEITAVTEYTIMTLGYLIMAAMSSVTLPKMRSCLSRLEEVLNIVPEITDDTSDDAQEPVPQAAALEFSHVSFSYHGAEEPVIKDLSFTCKAGETTAIIGSTGSGKSTVANLLLRLYDIDSGNIRLNGVDIRTMTQQKLREHIAYVPQKAFLFSGTIADNLRMGRGDADDEQIRRALSIAQSEAFVGRLSLGTGAPVAQGGANFSGGQKQRLSIARAILKNAPVLVFDDSFSALDFKTDSALRRALKKDVRDAVKLIIAQRISTIMDADQIIVLDEGQISGVGTHRELLKSCPVYRAIASSQLSTEEVQ